MAVYTNFKKIHSKEPNQKLSNYPQWHNQSISHLWSPYTHHKRKGNYKEPIAPQYHPKDTPAPSYVQTKPKCWASHGFFFVKGRPFLHTKSSKIYFRSVQACNNRSKSETIFGLKQVNTKYKDRCFIITDYHGNNEFEHLQYYFLHHSTCTHALQMSTSGKLRDTPGQSRRK